MLYVNRNSQTVYEREGGIECAADLRAQTIARYQNRLYISGPMLEVEAFPAFRSKKEAGAAKKAEKTNKAQEVVNDRNAREQLDRLIAINFQERVDLEIGLDYYEQPKSEAEAQRNIAAWIVNLRKEYKKRGIELKYVYVTPWFTETGRVTKRLHHHVVINAAGMSVYELMELWPFGRTHADVLQPDKNGLLGLSRYLHNHLHGSKRWVASKNLIKPDPKYPKKPLSKTKAAKLAQDYELARTYFEDKHPDYVFLHMEVRTSKFVSGAYIHVWMRRRDAWCARRPMPEYRERDDEYANMQGLRSTDQIRADRGGQNDALRSASDHLR